MSYNSYKSSYRGRGGGGFGSRGGYRGSSRGEGGWSSGGSRGRGSSSRGGSGRFNSWDKDGSGGYVESRGRYSGGSDYGSSERYTSSRGGREDSSYGRRYSRQGSPGRYENHRSSPEPPRKRIRSESGGGYQIKKGKSAGSSSMRRVHDDSYGSSGGAGGGNEYSGRSYSGGYGGSEDKGGAGSYGGSGERSRSYREERSRGDDYSYRKIMGPPSGPPRRSSPRGSYRGRSFRGSRSSMSFRGSRGFKRGEFSLAKKRLIDVSYSIKKKEYLRKLKMIKLKRLAERYRREKERSSLDKDEKKRLDKLNGEEEIDDEEEIEVEEEVETSVEEEEEEEEGEEREDEDGEVDEEKELEENGEKKDDEEELEEGETNDDDTAIKKKPKKKIVRKIVKKIVKKKIKKEKTAATKTKSKDKSDGDETKEGVHVTIKQDSETRAVNEEGRKNYLGRPFIRLECHHCNIRCVTFKEYNLHLHTAKHFVSMRKLSLKLRQQLARMRIEQRREQLILDQEHKDNPALRTFFCSTCKLNHRSLKGQHLASARHRKMKEFLMPYCRICRVTFKSPMGYENHLCELSHIRQTAKLEYLLTKRKEKEEAGRNVDMDNFMILDSVGSPDESEEESGKEEGETEKNGVAASAGEVGDEGEAGVKEKKDVKKKKKKTEIKLGLEFCKKVEVMYCELCNIYLTRHLPQDKVVAQHCRTRLHLERLVRANKYKRRSSRHAHSKTKDDDKEKTGKEGEAGEKDGKESADKSGGGSELDTSTATTSPTKKKGDATSELEDGDIDEKLWSEVDKDLGDLLREVEPEAKSSDEDEEREKSRYDRFKLSEKDKTNLKKEVTDDDDDAKVNSVGIKPTVKKSEPIKKKMKVEEVEDEEEEEEEDDDDDKEAKET